MNVCWFIFLFLYHLDIRWKREDLSYLDLYLWCLKHNRKLIKFVEWINSLSREHELSESEFCLFVYKALLSVISHILNPFFLLEIPYALRYGRTHLKDQTILRWFLWPKYIVQVLETKIMIIKCTFYWNKILLTVRSKYWREFAQCIRHWNVNLSLIKKSHVTN